MSPTFEVSLSRRAEAFERLAALLVADCSIDELLSGLLGMLIDAARMDVGVISLREGDSLRARAAVGLAQEVARGFSLPVATALPATATVGRGARGLCAVALDDDCRGQVMRDAGVRALYCLPFSDAGELLGAAYLGSLAEHAATEQDRDLLGALGARVAAALARHTAHLSLGQKARQLAEQNAEVERSNRQIEQARRALEDKAAELALSSKFKSEFLANMSHELRTPLNSILVLSQQLGDNREQTLTPRQIDFARTIHDAGTDLLNLITDILDLSKIESGTVAVEPAAVSFQSLLDAVGRPFRHQAETRGLSFDVSLDPKLDRSLVTDQRRLKQVLVNLLSNALKFTEQGGVQLNVSAVSCGWSADHPILQQPGTVVAFQVADTGIGIAPEHQRIIFEAFRQAEIGTSRKYGGTGLGLAISRELSNLLGGEIQLRSQLGGGSCFTLYLPLEYVSLPAG